MAAPGRLRAMLWYCRSIVWAASRLVPAEKRELWRVQQDRRFWHWCHFLAESNQLTASNRLLIARACWGLFPEAFWLRIAKDRFEATWRKTRGSSVAFLLALTVAVGAVVVVSGIVSAARLALARPVPDPTQVVTITLDGSSMTSKYSRTRSDTLLDLADVWGKSKLAEGLAPFSWAPGTVLLSSRDLPVGTARVDPNFFGTLGVAPILGRTFDPADARRCPNCAAVLSYPLWQHEFHADPNIIGKTVILNGNHRAVIGVLPPTFRLISPNIGIWILIDPATLFTNFQRRVGAVARLRPGTSAASLQRNLSDLTESAGYVHPSSQIQVATIAAQQRRNLIGLMWLAILCIGCATFVVVLRNIARGIGGLPPGVGLRMRWLAFLVAKSAMLLALAGVLTWTVVHWLSFWLVGSTTPIADEYAIWLFLPIATVALSWSVSDQKRRCRVCLQRLELPVDIGRTGSVLLNWAGTEMVCPRGHGVLYIPESEANSLDQDRWSKLDDSWEGLFRP